MFLPKGGCVLFLYFSQGGTLCSNAHPQEGLCGVSLIANMGCALFLRSPIEDNTLYQRPPINGLRVYSACPQQTYTMILALPLRSPHEVMRKYMFKRSPIGTLHHICICTHGGIRYGPKPAYRRVCNIPEFDHRGEYLLLSEDGVCLVSTLAYRGLFLVPALSYRWVAHENRSLIAILCYDPCACP